MLQRSSVGDAAVHPPVELVVGAPTTVDIYGPDGVLLLRAGSVIRSEAQRDLLLERQASAVGAGVPDAIDAPPAATLDAIAESLREGCGDPDGATRERSVLPRLRSPVEAVQLTLTIGDVRRKVPVEFVGILGRESIVVAAPEWQGQPFLPNRGAAVSVRLFAGRGIHLFDTTVLAASTQPLAHLHLAVPTQCATMEFRRHPRLRVDIPVVVHRGNASTLGATLENLSVGGCRVRAREPLGEVEDRVAVSFSLRVEGGEAPLRIAAIVRNRDGPHANGTWSTGLEFVQLAAGDRLALYAFVQAEMYRD
ncbi:MAG: flagellar brake protein [Burkholderiales bacterium]